MPEPRHEVRSAPPPKHPAAWYDPAAARHDFGLVLAGSDVARAHTFRIANTSGHPVRIRGVANRKPCCGDVAPVAARVVEPGQAIEVRVSLHIGLAAGHVLHVAEVETEGDDEAVEIRTEANAHARATAEEVGSFPGPLDPGQSRRVEYLVRTFGVEGNPPPPLDDRAIRCGLSTEWVGPPSGRVDAEAGLVEAHRTLAVTLPASAEPARRTESLEVLDGGGAVVGRRWIGWEVAPAIVASPAGLLFATDAKADAGLKVLVRRQDGRPFRITSATTEVGRLVVQVDGDDARPVHQLTASLDGPARDGPRTGEVVIRTDQPDQPVLKVAVYVARPKADAPEASP